MGESPGSRARSLRGRSPAPGACCCGAVDRLDYLMPVRPMQPCVRRSLIGSAGPAAPLRPRDYAPSRVGTAPPNERAGPFLRPCPRPSRQTVSRVARFGPTTPTRARRLADASVDPTEARNCPAVFAPSLPSRRNTFRPTAGWLVVGRAAGYPIEFGEVQRARRVVFVFHGNDRAAHLDRLLVKFGAFRNAPGSKLSAEPSLARMLASISEPHFSSPGERSCSDSDRRQVARRGANGGAVRSGARKMALIPSPSSAADSASTQSPRRETALAA